MQLGGEKAVMEKKAVVLSGGGARGAYQVGVWKALRDLHYHYDIVTGTSVGALNGVMMVQKDFHKCLKLWENINFETLFTDKFPKDTNGLMGTTKIYQKYATNFLKNGGMDTSRFENVVNYLYNPIRFFRSPIEFGTVTYNLTSHKTLEITKKEMTPETVPLYIIASASCYPAFPIKKIDGESYIDGGYSDNLPLHLALKLGATSIVAVDLKAVGRKRKVDLEGVDIIRIEPKNQITSFLVFQEDLSKKAICYGYNDTMKAFGKLEGNLFTFQKNQLKKEFEKNRIKLRTELELRLKTDSSLILERLLKMSLFYKLKNDTTGKKQEAFFRELVELIGRNLRMDDTKIYRMKPFSKKALQKLSKIDAIDFKSIEEKIKTKKIGSLLGTSTILRFLYDTVKNIPTTKKETNEYCRYALVFPKEFIAAVYLHIVNEQYHIIGG